MKAMILAAGQGTRLRPITDEIPKPMAPLAGKPLLEYNIELLKKHDVREIAINLHYRPETITNHFGNGTKWGVQITYSWESKLLGTAGAVKKLESFFTDAPFLLLYGDNLSNCNLTRLIDFHQAKKGIATIALYKREDVSQSGIAQLDKDARILRFLEKPRPEQVFSHFVNAGIYVLEPHILKYIPSEQPYDFSRELFPKLLNGGKRLYSYVMTEELLWVDTPEDYQRAQIYIADRQWLTVD